MTDGNHTIPCPRCGFLNMPPAVGKFLGTQLCEKCGEPTGAEARVASEPPLDLILHQLGTQEREVVRLAAERLLMGQKQYGVLDLESDRRNWPKEMRPEALDWIIYHLLAKMAQQVVDVGDALRRTHERCNELLAENRALKRQLEELAESALVVELDADDDEAELFAPPDDKDHGSN